MYLITPLALGTITAAARGKDLSRIDPGGRFQWPSLVIFALAVRVFLALPHSADRVAEAGLGPILNLVPLVFLVLFVVLNLHLKRILPALLLLAFGTFLNLITMALNGGYMPISLAALECTTPPDIIAKMQLGLPDGHNILIDGSSRLTFFGDVLYVSKPLASAFSIGDVIIGLGVFVLLQTIFPQKSQPNNV